MTEFVAMIIFVAIMFVGWIVWTIALYLALRIGKTSTNVDWGPRMESNFGLYTGETLVDASKSVLMDQIPRVFRRQYLGILNSVFKLEERTEQELLITRIGPIMCNLPIALYFSKIRFRLEPIASNQTRVLFTIDQANSMRILKRITSLTLLCLALPILLGVGLAVWYTVIPAQNAAVRWQVLQTLQIAHFIWPPFLFIGLASGATRASKQFVERVLMIAGDSELMKHDPV